MDDIYMQIQDRKDRRRKRLENTRVKKFRRRVRGHQASVGLVSQRDSWLAAQEERHGSQTGTDEQGYNPAQ